MSKHIKMLKCFADVMRNNREEIEKIIPNMYCESFYTIDEDYLLKKGINKLIVDIDGTILPADDIIVPIKLIHVFQKLKEKNIDICLVSNNGEQRVIPVAEKLQINSYLFNAKKPLPTCFDNALKLLKTTDKKKVAMVGDQMLSDIKGAHEYGLYTILVCPISKHQNIQTGTSRVLQNIMEHHLKKKDLFDKKEYYKEYTKRRNK